jgi:thiol-disulfide isomerase/thioredoxin
MKNYQLVMSVLSLVLTTGAWAAEPKPFSRAEYEQAKTQGKTVVLDFHADWCSTCAKQKPVLESLLIEKELVPVVAFTVDYDNENELKRELKIQKQSTLVVFKGKKEVARNMGLTDSAEIESLIQKGI